MLLRVVTYMDIGVVGGGAIGLMISSYLANKHTVTIYVRRHEQKKSINTFGLYRDGVRCKKNIKAYLIHEMKREEVYLVCVKQPQIKHVLPAIHAMVNNEPVLFLQNGMGHLEQVGNAKYPILVGIVEHGAIKLNDYSVKHIGRGTIKVAPYNKDADMLSYLVEKLDEKSFPVRMFKEWESLLKEKLIINAVINPLTALFHVRNGYILKVPHIKKLAYLLCMEAASVLKLDPDKSWESVKNVASNTSENISSMLNDIKNDQKTEIEAITGYIMRNSNKEIPNTAFIYHSIKALEDCYRYIEKK